MFAWDEPIGWSIADPSDSNAESFRAICTCKTKNIVWMKPPGGNHGDFRGPGKYVNAV